MRRFIMALTILCMAFIYMPVLADDHPPYLQEGDLASADFFNDWFETFAKGLGEITPQDLLGIWDAVSVSNDVSMSNLSSLWTNVDNLCIVLEGSTVTFKDDSDGTYSLETSYPNPFSCYSYNEDSYQSNFNIINNLLVMEDGVEYDITYINKTKYILTFTEKMNTCVPASIKLTKINPPPDIPSYLALNLNGDDVEVSWTDNSDDEKGFRIYRRDGLDNEFLEIGTAAENETFYTDTPGTGKFYYRVFSYNDNGESLFGSNIEVIEITGQ